MKLFLLGMVRAPRIPVARRHCRWYSRMLVLRHQRLHAVHRWGWGPLLQMSHVAWFMCLYICLCAHGSATQKRQNESIWLLHLMIHYNSSDTKVWYRRETWTRSTCIIMVSLLFISRPRSLPGISLPRSSLPPHMALSILPSARTNYTPPLLLLLLQAYRPLQQIMWPRLCRKLCPALQQLASQ